MKQLFTLLICSIGTLAFGQFSLGVQAGVNINHFDFDGNLEGIDNLRSTYTKPFIGLTPQYDVNDKWALSSGLYLYNRGVNIGTSTSVSALGINIPIGISTDFNTLHLDIPLTVQYKVIDGPISIHATGGLGISNIIDAKIKPRATAILDFNLPQIDISTNELNKLSSYAIVGIRGDIKTRGGKIFGDIQYQQSLESLNTTSIINLDIKNKGFSVGIGYAMSF